MPNVIHSFVLAVPSAPPQEAGGTADSPTLLALSWSPPPPVHINGPLQYYSVEITELHTGRKWTIVALDEALNVGSLHPYFIYSYRVAAYTVGLGPFSQPVSIQTLEAGKLRSVELFINLSNMSLIH